MELFEDLMAYAKAQNFPRDVGAAKPPNFHGLPCCFRIISLPKCSMYGIFIATFGFNLWYM